MQEIVTGVNEEELRVLSAEIIDRADRISEILDRVDACMDGLRGCYKGQPVDEILSRYNDLRASYGTVKANIMSYADDFTTLMTKVRENDKYLSHLFEGLTSDTQNQIRANNFSIK